MSMPAEPAGRLPEDEFPGELHLDLDRGAWLLDLHGPQGYGAVRGTLDLVQWLAEAYAAFRRGQEAERGDVRVLASPGSPEGAEAGTGAGAR